jgi:hypothetical protein
MDNLPELKAQGRITWEVFTLTLAVSAGVGIAQGGEAPATNGAAKGDGGGADPEAQAKATQNPVASLISLPRQNDLDWDAGSNGNGFRYRLNVQPVIPISLPSRSQNEACE